MTLRISVRGTAERSFPAETATVPIEVSVEAGSRDDAYRQAAALQDELTTALDELVDSWSSDQVRAHTWRDRHRGREVGKPRHEAKVTARARFTDFEVLEQFADAWLTREGVTIGYIQWDLTPENRPVREAQVRRAAVADAVAKAADYAESFGFAPPTPVRVSDDGMSAGFHEAQAMSFSAKGGDMDQPAISLVPQEIRVDVTVEAEFVAE